jgi:hydrogenase/urease accessory protein HupE
VGFADLRKLALASLISLAAATASAHEIGTTQIHALFRRDHTYSVTIRSLRKPQPDKVFLYFDGVQAHALTGDIPPHARTFSFRYEGTFSTYSLMLQNEGSDAVATQWLDAETTSKPFALSRDVIPPTRFEVIRQYLALGFTHILPQGIDHILFVLGLFLLATNMRALLSQITAFTIAHSISLALTMYGVVSLPSRVVEPAIALSIAFVAIENVITSRLHPWRVVVVFLFGLLHGMGFAGVLHELGLPRRQFVPALVSFNVGVEGGQLVVIAVAMLLFSQWLRNRRFVVSCSVAIALTGLFWTVQRIAF